MSNQFLDNLSEETLERVKTQSAGIRWLYEMELLQNPQLIDNLKLNIFMQHKRIKDVEILVDQSRKGILIYLKLNWWGNKFNQEEIKFSVEELMSNLLPNFRKRIIFNRDIFQMALDKAKELVRGNNEKSNNNSNVVSNNQNTSKSGLPTTSDLLPDQKEQAVNELQESDESEQRDIQDDSQTQSSS